MADGLAKEGVFYSSLSFDVWFICVSSVLVLLCFSRVWLGSVSACFSLGVISFTVVKKKEEVTAMGLLSL